MPYYWEYTFLRLLVLTVILYPCISHVCLLTIRGMVILTYKRNSNTDLQEEQEGSKKKSERYFYSCIVIYLLKKK